MGLCFVGVLRSHLGFLGEIVQLVCRQEVRFVGAAPGQVLLKGSTDSSPIEI